MKVTPAAIKVHTISKKTSINVTYYAIKSYSQSWLSGREPRPLQPKIKSTGPKTKLMYSTTQPRNLSNVLEYSSQIIRATVIRKQTKAALIAYAVNTTRIDSWGW